MTIGWAFFGPAWRKRLFIAMVRPQRHTFGLMEKAEEFTVSIPTTRPLKEELAFAGSRSGRESLIYASGILDNMRNKEMRISFLMLPATMLEKYVARFLMATLGFIIAAIVGMLLAEVTRYILLPLFDLPDVFHSSALFKVFSMLTIDGEQAFRGSYAFNMEYMPWLGEACGWSFLIWSHSLYVLGGSFWYKRAFLKTLGTLIVISILGSIITVQIVEWIGEEGMMGLHDWLEENFQWMTLNKLLAFGGAFFSAFTMFNWWLGYKLFTRSQVIKPKFRLL